jgi:hypothetical protein
MFDRGRTFQAPPVDGVKGAMKTIIPFREAPPRGWGASLSVLLLSFTRRQESSENFNAGSAMVRNDNVCRLEIVCCVLLTENIFVNARIPFIGVSVYFQN